jgi:hypothetical protein
MRRTQRGITFIGWLFLLIPVAIVGYSAIRLVPVYLNYSKVVRSMDQMAEEARAGDSATSLRFGLEKRLDIEGITFPDIKDFVIRRDGQSWVIEIEYEDGAPLLSNLSVTARFDKSVRLGQAPD